MCILYENVKKTILNNLLLHKLNAGLQKSGGTYATCKEHIRAKPWNKKNKNKYNFTQLWLFLGEGGSQL